MIVILFDFETNEMLLRNLKKIIYKDEEAMFLLNRPYMVFSSNVTFFNEILREKNRIRRPKLACLLFRSTFILLSWSWAVV